MFSDGWISEKIENIIKEYGDKEVCEQFKNISSAYIAHANKEYDKSNELLSNINIFDFGKVGQAEINRLKFKNCYSNSKYSHRFLNNAYNYLIKIIYDPIELAFQEGTISNDENILRLKIIYDIAPYVLDILNDWELFQQLYILSNEILKKCNKSNSIYKTVEYINNIFNRKAFLFVNPMATDDYYEQAKSFFKKNNIKDEYCITLICQAGTLIVCNEFNKAICLCREANKLINDEDVLIPHKEKLLNNLKIAEFLLFEETNTDIEKIKNIATKTIIELMSNLPKKNCSSKHVILTNVASLYLYINDLDNYKKTKHMLEDLLYCKDISNINDNNIDDFYRYYFAWFEVYFNMQNQNWDECKIIIGKLDNFVPALFKSQESFWDEKNQSALNLVNKQKTVNGYDFCNNLVKNNHQEKQLSKFYHRGLMLSDLQYTSYN